MGLLVLPCVEIYQPERHRADAGIIASMAWNLHAIEQMRVDGVGRPTHMGFHTGGGSRGPEAGEHAGPEEQGRAERLERFTEEIRRTKQQEESLFGGTFDKASLFKDKPSSMPPSTTENPYAYLRIRATPRGDSNEEQPFDGTIVLRVFADACQRRQRTF